MNEKTKKYIYLVHIPIFFVNALLHQLLYGFIQQTLLGISTDFSIEGALLRTTNAWIDYFVYIIFLIVFYTIEYRKILLDKAVRITETQMQLSRSFLSEMRNRLHPEFFFFSLNSIQTAIQHDKFREADKIMSSLSNFLRGTVYGSQDAEVELREELKLIESYLEARALCTDTENVYSVVCPAELKEALILNRQLFSFAEDVFKQDMNLTIRDDFNTLVVTISGSVFCAYADSVALVKKYMQEYYGSRGNVLSSENDGRLIVEVRLPLTLKN